MLKMKILYGEQPYLIWSIFAEIYEASDGVEALDIYKSNKIDMIMTDIEMPNMNGLSLCKEIRITDKKIPIIITTAYTSTEYLQKL